MYNKWMEAHPKDIVWRNLDDGALEMKSRYVISWLSTGGLIFVWAFPVGFIGTLSNLSNLCERVQWVAIYSSLSTITDVIISKAGWAGFVKVWLHWIPSHSFIQTMHSTTAPNVARGLIEGVLPPLLLAIMFALLPFILQGMWMHL